MRVALCLDFVIPPLAAAIAAGHESALTNRLESHARTGPRRSPFARVSGGSRPRKKGRLNADVAPNPPHAWSIPRTRASAKHDPQCTNDERRVERLAAKQMSLRRRPGHSR